MLIVLMGAAQAALGAEEEPRWLLERLSMDRPFFRPDPAIPFNTVRRLEFDPEDSATFYSAGDDKVVRKWKVVQTDDGRMQIRPVEVFRWPLLPLQPRGEILGLGVGQKDGIRLLAFGGNGLRAPPEVRLVDLSRGQEIARLVAPDFPHANVFAVAFHPTEPLLAVCLNDGTAGSVAIWRTTLIPEFLTQFDVKLPNAFSMSFSPKGDRLAVADRKGIVKVWEVEFEPQTGKLSQHEISKAEWQAKPATILGLSWLDNDTWAAATEEHGLVFGFAATGELREKPATTLILNKLDRTVQYRDKIAEGQWSGVKSLDAGRQYSQNGSQALGFYLEELRHGVVKTPGRQLRYEIRLPQPGSPVQLLNVAEVTALCSAPQVMRMALGVWDFDQVRLFKSQYKPGLVLLRAEHGAAVPQLEQSGFDGRVEALACSLDGKSLLAAGVDRYSDQGPSGIVIRLWEPTSGRLIAQYPAERDLQETQAGAAITNLAIDSRSAPNVPNQTIAIERGVYSEQANRKTSASTTSIRPPASRFQLTYENKENPRGFRTKPVTIEAPRWKWESDGARLFWYDSKDGSGKTRIGPFSITREWRLMGEIGHPQCALRFQSRKKGDLLAVGYKHGILIWDVNQVQRNSEMRLDRLDAAICRGFLGHDGATSALAVDESADWLLSGSADGTICAWSLDGIETDRANRKELGLELELGASEKSLTVKKVSQIAPGFAAGFMPGQEILSVTQNGVSLTKTSEWQAALQNPVPGEHLVVTVQWNSEEGTKSSRFRVWTQVFHEPIWTLYPLLNEKDWAIWSPEGFFDGRLNDRKEIAPFLGWQINDPVRFFSANLGRELYRERGLFTELLKSSNRQQLLYLLAQKRPNLLGSMATIREGEPTRDAAQTFDVKIHVDRVANEKLTELQVWCNSAQLYRFDKSNPDELKALSRGMTKSIPIDKSYLRSDQPNTLTAVALSELNGNKLTHHDRMQQPRRIREEKSRRLHFVGIGVTELQHEDSWQSDLPIPDAVVPLEFAANDVAFLGMALGDLAGGRDAGFQRGTTRVLIDQDQLKPRREQWSAFDQERWQQLAAVSTAPTRQNILQALKDLVEQDRPAADDLVIILLAGHGFDSDVMKRLKAMGGAVQPSSDEQDEGGFYFTARDTHPLVSGSFVSRADLDEWLNKLPCNALLLVDACNSGQKNWLQQAKVGFWLGPLIMTSSREREASWEKHLGGFGRGHGLFTATFIEGLTGIDGISGRPLTFKSNEVPLDTNLDGNLSVYELCAYAERRVDQLRQAILSQDSSEAVQDLSDSQHPQVHLSATFPAERIQLKKLDRGPR